MAPRSDIFQMPLGAWFSVSASIGGAQHKFVQNVDPCRTNARCLSVDDVCVEFLNLWQLF